jgi:gamma-glutamyltranspeptidase/glutathione hydrolase
VPLHNRGHFFSLDDDHVNRLEPGKRTLHTLIASMAFRDGDLRLVFGTMGADGQAQTTVQVLERWLAGAGPQEAVSAPRILHGRFAAEDDPDELTVEATMGAEVIDELSRRGLEPRVATEHEERLGHAHAIELRADGTLAAGADPRSDGAAVVVE